METVLLQGASKLSHSEKTDEVSLWELMIILGVLALIVPFASVFGHVISYLLGLQLKWTWIPIPDALLFDHGFTAALVLIAIEIGLLRLHWSIVDRARAVWMNVKSPESGALAPSVVKALTEVRCGRFELLGSSYGSMSGRLMVMIPTRKPEALGAVVEALKNNNLTVARYVPEGSAFRKRLYGKPFASEYL